MTGIGMTPPSTTGYALQLTDVEIEALLRWHRVEALVVMDGPLSRGHMMRADLLRRMLLEGA